MSVCVHACAYVCSEHVCAHMQMCECGQRYWHTVHWAFWLKMWKDSWREKNDKCACVQNMFNFIKSTEIPGQQHFCEVMAKLKTKWGCHISLCCDVFLPIYFFCEQMVSVGFILFCNITFCSHNTLSSHSTKNTFSSQGLLMCTNRYCTSPFISWCPMRLTDNDVVS